MEVRHNTIEIDGRPIHDGATLSVDHVVQEFTVKVRSLSGVGAASIKEQLQKKWEVVGIVETAKNLFVRAGIGD